MTRTDRNQRRRLAPAARQEAIIEAARLAFAEQPYDQVSMAAIARSAGASEALAYHYFGSKADLHAEVLRGVDESIAEAQAAAVAGLPADAGERERVRAHVDAYLDAIRGDGLSPIGGTNPTLREEQQARLRALVGLRSGADYAVTGALAFLDAAVALWLERGAPTAQRVELADAVTGAFLGAVARPERRGKFGNRF